MQAAASFRISDYCTACGLWKRAHKRRVSSMQHGLNTEYDRIQYRVLYDKSIRLRYARFIQSNAGCPTKDLRGKVTWYVLELSAGVMRFFLAHVGTYFRFSIC